ncbi:MAG TPA: hypothetical protein VNZ55_05310 [Thermomicrobiales bacterium]|nr:hypothetical protein [Thermomicrobiales bacterium]
MPMHDIADHPLIASLHDAFGDLVEDGIVDIVSGDESGEPAICEVQADTWTLVLEGWPLESAWIAIDDDVSDVESGRAALESTLDRRELVAMIALDDSLTGSLTNSLRDSGDDLSVALAEMIAAGT